MDLEPHETTYTAKGGHVYSQLLKQEIPGNPNNTSVEEIDDAIITFTSTITSKNILKTISYIPTSRLGHPRSQRALAKKKKSKENMHNFNRAADGR
jgi:hypothetical protein